MKRYIFCFVVAVVFVVMQMTGAQQFKMPGSWEPYSVSQHLSSLTEVVDVSFLLPETMLTLRSNGNLGEWDLHTGRSAGISYCEENTEGYGKALMAPIAGRYVAIGHIINPLTRMAGSFKIIDSMNRECMLYRSWGAMRALAGLSGRRLLLSEQRSIWSSPMASDGTIKLLDILTEKTVRTYAGFYRGERAFGVFPECEECFISCAEDQLIRIWDVRQKEMVDFYSALSGHASWRVSPNAVSDDALYKVAVINELQFVSNIRHKVHMWDLRTSRPLPLRESLYRPAALCPISGCSCAISAGGDVKLWDISEDRLYQIFSQQEDRAQRDGSQRDESQRAGAQEARSIVALAYSSHRNLFVTSDGNRAIMWRKQKRKRPVTDNTGIPAKVEKEQGWVQRNLIKKYLQLKRAYSV